MRARIVRTIFLKELRESLRDRRTLMMMVALPLLLYPLMILGLGKLQESQEEASEARVSHVSVWGQVTQPLLDRLRADNDLDLHSGEGLPEDVRRDLEGGRFSPPPPEPRTERRAAKKDTPKKPPMPETALLLAARSFILSRKTDGVLLAWPGLPAALDSGGLGHLSIFFDSVRTDSGKAGERLQEDIAAYRKVLVEQRERAHGLAQGFSTGVEIHRQNVASSKRQSGQFLGGILPFALVFMSAMGGFYAAIELTAGEKERGTMQTLLCAPLRPTEIIFGKFLAAWTLGLLASMANIVSLGATFARITLPGGTIKVDPAACALAFLMLIPVSFTVTALYLAIAVFARDFKDGQNYLTPMLFALMIPLGATMLPGVELNAWTAFAPIVNIALLIKGVFLGEAPADMMFLTLLSSMAYALLAILLAARVFGTESLLLGGRATFRGIFRPEPRQGGLPSPATGLTFFAVMQVVFFYGSLTLQSAGVLPGLLAAEFGFFLLPVLALIAAMGFSFPETLSLRRPPVRAVAGSVLLGFSAWAVAAGVLLRLLPPPDSLVKALRKVILLEDSHAPLWIILLVVAVTPALCEELLFRGLLLSSLKSLGKWPALLITALLFGLAHSSIYRLLPTMFLGLVLGYVVWQTGSVWCSMIVHAVNNGLLATLAFAHPAQVEWVTAAKFLPWTITLAGAVVMLAGWVLIPKGGGMTKPPGISQ